MKSQTIVKILIIITTIFPVNLSCQSKVISQNSEIISPENALEKFYNYQGTEESNMDVLIIAGDKVVPLILEEIKNKNMPKRRYAIGFLGNGEYKIALPRLEAILNDSEERDIFRGDALLSIYQINKEIGLTYAKKHEQDSNFVGEISKDIINNASYINERRTYDEALKSYPNL